MIIPIDVFTVILEYLPTEEFLKCHELSRAIYNKLTKTFYLYETWSKRFKSEFLRDAFHLPQFKEEYDKNKNDYIHWKREYMYHFSIKRGMKINQILGSENDVSGEIWSVSISGNGEYVHTCGSERKSHVWKFDNKTGKLGKSFQLYNFNRPNTNGNIDYTGGRVVMRADTKIVSYYLNVNDAFKKSEEEEIDGNEEEKEDNIIMPNIVDRSVPYRSEVVPTFFGEEMIQYCISHHINEADPPEVNNYSIIRISDEKSKTGIMLDLKFIEDKRCTRVKKLNNYELRKTCHHHIYDIEKCQEKELYYILVATYSFDFMDQNWGNKVDEQYVTGRDCFFYVTIPYGLEKYVIESLNAKKESQNNDEKVSIIFKMDEYERTKMEFQILDMRLKDKKAYINTREHFRDSKSNLVTDIGKELILKIYSLQEEKKVCLLLYTINTNETCFSYPTFIIKLEVTDDFIITGSEEGNILVYNRNHVSCILKQKIHEKLVNSVRLWKNEDEKKMYIISGSDDETIKISVFNILGRK